MTLASRVAGSTTKTKFRKRVLPFQGEMFSIYIFWSPYLSKLKKDEKKAAQPHNILQTQYLVGLSSLECLHQRGVSIEGKGVLKDG